MTRRTLMTSLAAAASVAAPSASAKSWRPKLGLLGNYSEANINFAKEEGFTSIGLWARPGTSLDPTQIGDPFIETVRESVRKSGLYLSVVGNTMNHIAADSEIRKKNNDYFVKVIELAGKLGAPYVGSGSGGMQGKTLDQQVSEIVRVYTEQYFPMCQKYNVRILWEPYPGSPNVATGPVGYDALFKAFGNSPYVGLQYDPSHLVWQMMDPIQTARDYVDKIYDVHLKDTEIRYDVLKRVGIHPLNDAKWWRYRLPGLGLIDWPTFFTVLMNAGYSGAMNIEHEDATYGDPNHGNEFAEDYRRGFRMAHRYLRQYVPA